MKRLIIALAIGTGAGIVDIIPMIFLNATRGAVGSAFLHWIVLAFVICYMQLGVANWCKGLIVALAAAVPVMAMVAEGDPKALLPITVMSALLGTVVGYLTGRFAPAG
jgi:hypothetical protein